MKNKLLNRIIMSKDFDEFVNRLQKEINEIEIQNHNERIVNLCYNPENWGKPSEEEVTVSEERYGGPKGYFLGLYLKIEKNIITKANFITNGCGVMIATGSQTTILIKGHSIEFAEEIVRPYYRGNFNAAMQDLILKALAEQDFVQSHIAHTRTMES